MKKITVLGGGTGTYVTLSGLKNYPFDLGVIVTMMDSGGSTGRLRDQLGVLPPGDLRQALVALSETSSLWRKLFLYRFENGDLKGHNFGNIFLSALEKVSSNYNEVITTAGYVLKSKGKVIPVTFDKTNLCAEYENGSVLKEEKTIDSNFSENSRIKTAYLEPQVNANPYAIKRIKESDYLIIGPGDLYTSIIPILLVNGIKEAVVQSQAKIIYNMNLMTKSGQTKNYLASDHLTDLVKYLGKTPDIILVNNQLVPNEILQWYESKNEHQVKNNLVENGYQGQVVESDLIDYQMFEKSSVDELCRSILRHNPDKLAKQLVQLLV